MSFSLVIVHIAHTEHPYDAGCQDTNAATMRILFFRNLHPEPPKPRMRTPKAADAKS